MGYVLFAAQQCQDALPVMIQVHVQPVNMAIIFNSQFVGKGFAIHPLNVFIFVRHVIMELTAHFAILLRIGNSIRTTPYASL
jgi:hypothetical protein